ncbi:hypothetical protein ACQY1H_16790 [Agrobacterium vitis]|uniref:hypothetical protein n=1 Tax=Agrobacterium vitis TaxID=373 RepID=UPI003D2A468A
MAENYSKSRQQAEIAFDKEQSQFFARGRAVEEQDSLVLAREEKTLRLREARLAKESQDQQMADAATAAKSTRKA